MQYVLDKPQGWLTIQEKPDGLMMRHPSKKLVVISSANRKEDGKVWQHVSVSRQDRRLPSHEDLCLVKEDFIGDKYAYTIFPPKEMYVNLGPVLHLWCCLDGDKILPEMSGMFGGVRSI